MKLTIDALCVGTGCTVANAKKWLPALSQAMQEFRINTPRRAAAFLANVGVESGGLTRVVENLNYSAERMAVVWPTRYAVPGSSPKRPNALAVRLAHNPEALANNVYADRMGNGPEASGDGFQFRGRALIQITGRDNHTRIGKRLGLDLVNHPELLEEPINAARSSCQIWVDMGCNEMADKDMFSQIVKSINGQLPCPANEGSLRKTRYKNCVEILNQSS